MRSGAAYGLNETDWFSLEGPEGAFYTAVEDARPVMPAPAATINEKPLWVSADGTAYLGGKTDLTVVHPDGRRQTWPLPETATGTTEPLLVQATDGRL